ncbi:hypothetical protein Scep_011958 [Stephania cephalantha]|uniref:Secreted peptide n=1 Tax=Stephania cephalantha TaxID=152367 RepID=A0AAP0P8X3_9MAGN
MSPRFLWFLLSLLAPFISHSAHMIMMPIHQTCDGDCLSPLNTEVALVFAMALVCRVVTPFLDGCFSVIFSRAPSVR